MDTVHCAVPRRLLSQYLWTVLPDAVGKKGMAQLWLAFSGMSWHGSKKQVLMRYRTTPHLRAPLMCQLSATPACSCNMSQPFACMQNAMHCCGQPLLRR